MSELIFKDVQPTLSQEQTGYVALSPKTGQQACANCQFFLATNYVHDYELGAMVPLGPACALVNGHPEPILPTGWCKEWRLRQPYESEPMEVEIVEGDDDEEAAPTIVEETAQKSYKLVIAPSNLPAAQKIMRSLRGELQPGLMVTRDGGVRHMLIVTSNGFKDRHNEHVMTAALDEYVKSFDAGTAHPNKHMFWHRVPVGKIIAAKMVNGFLVEIAEETVGDIISKMFYDHVETHPDDWAASMGFWAQLKDIQGRSYRHIAKVETTTLPRGEEANEYTLSLISEVKMAKFDEEMEKIWGNGALKALDKGVGGLRAHLLARGKVVKQGAEAVAEIAEAVAEAEANPPADLPSRDKLILQLVDGMEVIVNETRAILEKIAASESKANEADERDSEEIKSLKKALEDQQKAHAADLAEIREKMKMAPRIASQASDTEITDQAEIDKAKERIAPKNVKLFGGLQVVED